MIQIELPHKKVNFLLISQDLYGWITMYLISRFELILVQMDSGSKLQ